MDQELKKELEAQYYESILDYEDIIPLFYKFTKTLPTLPYFVTKNVKSKKELLDYLYEKYLDYSRQSCQNLLLGNYELYKAGLRIMVENYIIMLGIKKGNNNIWKKYYLQSFYNTYKQLNELPILKKSIFTF